MIEVIYRCDVCNDKIPVVRKKDIFGVEREYIQTGSFHYTGDTSFKIPGLCVCESCAHRIDVSVLTWKNMILSKL